MTVEALTIAAVGTVAALIVASWAGGALRTLVFPNLQWPTDAVNGRVLLFAASCAVLVALVATVAPAIRMTRADVAKALRSAAPQLVMSTGRLRQSLLVLQVALSVLLVVGGAVFSQSLRRAYEFDMGVDLDRIVVSRFFLEADTIGGNSRRIMLEEAARRAKGLPGVDRVSIAASIPLLGNGVRKVNTAGLDSARFAVTWDITPELVNTVGFRVVRGRSFTEDDVRGGASALMPTETLARQLWPGKDPIGRCARVGVDSSPCLPVVGVVRDLRQRSVREDAAPAVLVGTAAPDLSSSLSAYLVTRTTADPRRLVSELQRVFRDVHPDVATLEIRRYSESLDADYRPLRLGAAMFGSFAVLSVLLAAVGLYGVLSFTVTQRTSEFGVRAALGARRSRIIGHVMGGGLAIVGAGLALGGATGWLASDAVQALLFNTDARAITPYAVAALVLGVVAVGAAAIPAWRASSVDPAIALRAE
jgi:predicted permease